MRYVRLNHYHLEPLNRIGRLSVTTNGSVLFSVIGNGLEWLQVAYADDAPPDWAYSVDGQRAVDHTLYYLPPGAARARPITTHLFRHVIRPS